MALVENIEALERRLWSSADNLRSNSHFASNEYFLPVMGLIFLRHAYSRFLAVKPEVEASLPKRKGKARPLTKEDFSRKGAIYLKPIAEFDYLVSLKDSENRAQAVLDAMESIEADYKTLDGVLPKTEYQELDNDVLGKLLRIFNDPALKTAKGDVFGRIYEYFLTKFADQKAHDGGEFFTPVSLVQTIVNVIEPDHGDIIDPACGSGGMFAQSAHFIERMHKNPQDVATFYGSEKNPTTIRLAKMNLAVHGLEGNVQKAITYYEDPHEFLGQADFVMANPPFNVDEVDAEKIKSDPRLPFGLPPVNDKGVVSNGNYLWISYFYSYLNEQGRAGFVMSSQSSSAGGGEKEVRRKLVESGHVDVMIAIRSNFFYTRSVPCELWFFNKKKPKSYKDKVLMLDARNVYRQVTRKICDFSPEQTKNLSAIIWLYRGQQKRFLKLIESYFDDSLNAANDVLEPMNNFIGTLDKFLNPDPSKNGKALKFDKSVKDEVIKSKEAFQKACDSFDSTIQSKAKKWKECKRDNFGLLKAVKIFEGLKEEGQSLINSIEQPYRFMENELRGNRVRSGTTFLKEMDEFYKNVLKKLTGVGYFLDQARWLQTRFPKAELCDVEGLVKLVDQKEIEENDWSLTPGRYVGVAPETEEDGFDFKETMKKIHEELKELDKEAVQLSAQIQKNFEELGV